MIEREKSQNASLKNALVLAKTHIPKMMVALLGTFQQKGSATSMCIDEFLAEVYSLADRGDLQAATDKIFETVDRLLLAGEFVVCDQILRHVDVRRLPTALRRSFLTITAGAKDKLPARKGFYEQVFSEMIHLKGNENAQRILGELG